MVKDSFVYFIQERDDGPIKIGWTTHPEVRLARLQVGNPYKLHLRAAYRAKDRAVEQALHKLLAQHRIRGEWFSPHPEVLSWIRRWELEPFVGLALAGSLAEPELEFAPDDDDYNLELLEREGEL